MILFILAILEIIIRVFKLAPKLPCGHNIYRKADMLPYQLKKNITQIIDVSTGDCSFTVTHNSVGLRDSEHGEKEKYRILALGDSFTYGWGSEYESTFLRLLEQWIKVDIIKAGIPGYDVASERMFLEVYQNYYNPDMVLLCLAPNDVVCINSEKLIVTKNGYLVWKNPFYIISWVLFRYSHLCRIVLRFIMRSMNAIAVVNNIEKVKEEILKIKELAGNRKFIVLLLPDPINPRIEIYDWFKENNIQYIDAYFNTEYLFWKDGHCKPEGNHLIARMAYGGLDRCVCS